MKTCTQISDSRFCGKINVVNPGDSAKRAITGIGRLAFHMLPPGEIQPSYYRASPIPRGLALLHTLYKH